MGKVGFFEETEGHKSSLRLNLFIFLILTCAVVIFACYEHYAGKELSFSDSVLYFLMICVTTIFFPKLADKGMTIIGAKFGIKPTQDEPAKTDEQK